MDAMVDADALDRREPEADRVLLDGEVDAAPVHVRLPDRDAHPAALLERLRDLVHVARVHREQRGVAFVPGAPFYAANPDPATLRLSFATANVEKIEEGVARLGRALG